MWQHMDAFLRRPDVKRTRFSLFVTLAFVVTCGYLLSGCSSSANGGNSNLPKPVKAGTATNKVLDK